MRSLFAAGVGVQDVLERRGWRFCFIGGVANYRWGTARLTNDLGLTLLTGFGSQQPYIDALLTQFEPRIADAGAFAARHRVLLLRTAEGIALVLRTCSAEDLAQLEAVARRTEEVIGPFPRT